MQWQEKKNMWICWYSPGKICEMASSKSIISRFLPFRTSVWHVWACCGFNLLLMAGNWLFAIVSAWQFACQRFDFTDTFWQLAANSSAQPSLPRKLAEYEACHVIYLLKMSSKISYWPTNQRAGFWIRICGWSASEKFNGGILSRWVTRQIW